MNYDINSALVARRGIYKDVYGTPKDREYSDYQLRPNFPVAMAVAPELFDPIHAMEALHTTHTALLGPLGMKTLDPQDHAYRGNYDNSNDGDDKSIAKGWNVSIETSSVVGRRSLPHTHSYGCCSHPTSITKDL